MTLSPGSHLGPYEAIAGIGAGGMGEVYRARDTRLNRIVAITVLAPALAGDAEFRAQFEREARAIAALSHPNISTIYDVGRHDVTDFIVMEYCDGETLAKRLGRGALDLTEALRVAIAIADALDKTIVMRRAPATIVEANQFVILPPDKSTFSPSTLAQAISPDGRHLAFVASGRNGASLLWIRSLDSVTARSLVGTEDADAPFWSPDGRSVGFFAGGKLKRIDVTGGPAQTLDGGLCVVSARRARHLSAPVKCQRPRRAAPRIECASDHVPLRLVSRRPLSRVLEDGPQDAARYLGLAARRRSQAVSGAPRRVQRDPATAVTRRQVAGVYVGRIWRHADLRAVVPDVDGQVANLNGRRRATTME